VEASEQALQRYREQTDSVALEDKQNIVVQKLADLNAAVTRAKTERLQKEAAYQQIQTIQNDRSALDTFPAILANTFIQQLKGQLAELQRQQASLGEKYGEKHPEMIKVRSAIDQTQAKLDGEIGKVVQSIRNEYTAAQAQEKSLVTALEQQKSEAMALSRKGIDYGVLQRDANTNRQMFDNLLQRAKETGVTAELKTSNIRVVDPAEVPRRPVRPNKTLNLLLALFGGSLFAVGLTFFFEYLDNRIKSPEEIKHVLGLPFLGLVPALTDGEGTANTLLHTGTPTGFAEAFRNIRTNVLFSSAEEGGHSIVVTSTGPGEGKTLCAGNLSIALAQAGQRVLLVDADMRKPRVHSAFGEKAEPGLSNVLVGNAKASEAVRRGPVQNLYLLLAGVTPPNPAELLGSQRFKDFLGTLQDHFDWVVLDSPPVMAVTDASIIAHIAHGVVYVVAAEQTSRHTAAAALEQLETARAKFLGGILNKVHVERHSYYYSHYYRKDYSSYYSNVSQGS
jgi:capsular exopolysaccharide synthesis family protein